MEVYKAFIKQTLTSLFKLFFSLPPLLTSNSVGDKFTLVKKNMSSSLKMRPKPP